MGPAVVLARGGGYDMCDTYRGTDDYRDGADAYRSGYADSVESQTWTRDDGCAGIASPLDSGAWGRDHAHLRERRGPRGRSLPLSRR